jgi:MFS family permease
MATKSNFNVIIALILVIIIDTMGIGLFFPVLSPLFMSANGILPIDASLGLRDFLYALVFGLFCLCMFFSAPIIGDLSDQWGRKRILLICLFGTVLSALLCAFAIEIKNIPLLIIGRLLAGVVAGCQPIAQAAIIDISDEKSKTKNLGLIGMASCIGFVIGPVVGGYLSDSSLMPWFNYSTPFLADALLAVINFFMLIFIFKDNYIASTKKSFDIKRQLRIFTDAFRHREVRNLSLVFLLYETSWALYFQFMSVYLIQVHSYSSRQIGLFMSFVGLILGITFLIIVRIALRFFRERKIVFYSLLLSGISLFLPLFFTSEKGQWLSVIPITIGVGLAWNTVLTLFSNAVTEEQQGWVMGISSSVASMAWVPGVLLTAGLDYLDFKLPFVVAGILMFVSAILLVSSPQKQRNMLENKETKISNTVSEPF